MGRGRPRKPLAQHVLEGTYRKDRHGPLPRGAGGELRSVDPFAVDYELPVPRDLEGESARRWWRLLAGLMVGKIGPVDQALLHSACWWLGLEDDVLRRLDEIDPASREYRVRLRTAKTARAQARKILKRFPCPDIV